VFDVEALVADCQAAVHETEPHRAVRQVLERTVSDAAAVGDAFKPKRGGFDILYSAADLTVINFVWPPHMTLFPHDHRMWAVIGLYTGQEDNVFYRRAPEEPTTVTENGGKELRTGDVFVLGKEAIHGVRNPLGRITAAIHVYGGDFVNQPRSQWGPGPLEERPFDLDEVRTQFADANTAAGLTS
jgi:predicted metal-dependent enzyme (double-stranded beta helix superfamily)